MCSLLFLNKWNLCIIVISLQCLGETGDLTDAKAKNNMYSKQYIEEWMTYKKVMDYCNQQFRTTWLDVKGNHGML